MNEDILSVCMVGEDLFRAFIKSSYRSRTGIPPDFKSSHFLEASIFIDDVEYKANRIIPLDKYLEFIRYVWDRSLIKQLENSDLYRTEAEQTSTYKKNDLENLSSSENLITFFNLLRSWQNRSSDNPTAINCFGLQYDPQKITADSASFSFPSFCQAARIEATRRFFSGRDKTNHPHHIERFISQKSQHFVDDIFKKKLEEDRCSHWYYEMVTGVSLVSEISSAIAEVINRRAVILSQPKEDQWSKNFISSICTALNNCSEIIYCPFVYWRSAFLREIINDTFLSALSSTYASSVFDRASGMSSYQEALQCGEAIAIQYEANPSRIGKKQRTTLKDGLVDSHIFSKQLQALLGPEVSKPNKINIFSYLEHPYFSEQIFEKFIDDMNKNALKGTQQKVIFNNQCIRRRRIKGCHRGATFKYSGGEITGHQIDFEYKEASIPGFDREPAFLSFCFDTKDPNIQKCFKQLNASRISTTSNSNVLSIFEAVHKALYPELGYISDFLD